MTHRIEETVSRGMCIGCGACGVATRGAIPITLSSRRIYQADLMDVPENLLRVGSRVCPFSDESPNEDALVAPHGDPAMPKDPMLGQVSKTFAGGINDDEAVLQSSSGGLTSWLLQQLVKRDHVDAVINVGRPGPSEGEIFGYSVAEPDQIGSRTKSQYYASTMIEALEVARESGRRFAIVGIPCFIRAARALCASDPALQDRLVLFVAIVCGHYKTQAFAESLAWQVGVPPQELADVDFRMKNMNRPASAYDFGARAVGEEGWRTRKTLDLVGGNWGHNAFQPEACNFCDDVVGETADVSFGDAWLPQFSADPRGTNVVITRNRMIDAIFDQGSTDGEIWTTPLSTEEATQTQAGGFRHRREGLAVRLADDTANGLSVPHKRVKPNTKVVSPRRANLLRQRRSMAAKSHELFAKAVQDADLSTYTDGMQSEIEHYRRIDSPPARQALRKVKRLLQSTKTFISRSIRKGHS